MSATPTIQYGVFYRDAKGGIPKVHASIDTTSHETVEAALSEALALKQYGCLVLNVFSIDTMTGAMQVIFDAHTITDKLAEVEWDSYSTEEQVALKRESAIIERGEAERGAA